MRVELFEIDFSQLDTNCQPDEDQLLEDIPSENARPTQNKENEYPNQSIIVDLDNECDDDSTSS